MGWVATPEMTAAVSNAGAIGFLAAATLVPERVEAEIEKVKALTDAPFGVNFLMDAPGADVISDAIVRQGVRAAGYNRAPSAELIQKLKDGGVVCVPTCGAVRHAVKAQKLGADIIIVQGGEGGGHTGPVPTSLLVPGSVDAVGNQQHGPHPVARLDLIGKRLDAVAVPPNRFAQFWTQLARLRPWSAQALQQFFSRLIIVHLFLVIIFQPGGLSFARLLA